MIKTQSKDSARSSFSKPNGGIKTGNKRESKSFKFNVNNVNVNKINGISNDHYYNSTSKIRKGTNQSM